MSITITRISFWIPMVGFQIEYRGSYKHQKFMELTMNLVMTMNLEMK